MIDQSCEQAKLLMTAAWAENTVPGELDEQSAAWLQMHLAGCADCSAEMAVLGSMWQKLGDIPVPEPSRAMRARWEQTLESLTVPQYALRPVAAKSWWQNFWPTNAAWQMAIAGLCLAVGLGAGLSMQRGPSEKDEVAKLHEEIRNTKEMVALSLLQQQSAAERLRGVDYSTRMSSMEPQVVTALIQAVNRDTSVNVRLAAIDALGKVANDTGVRRSLTSALPQQDSPMVQAALIDYLVQAQDRNALPVIRDLVAQPDVNPTVRVRATYAVSKLAQ